MVEMVKQYNMSGILYLTADDFVLKSGEKGNLLCTTQLVKGLCIVLFYSNDCQHSANLLKKYKQLPRVINGCQFALININKPSNFSVVRLSQNTISPITFVPDIILYVDGTPFIRYDGPHEIPPIKQFILDIYQRLHTSVFTSPQSGSARSTSTTNHHRTNPDRVLTDSGIRKPPITGNNNHNRNTTNSTNTIPAYSIGRPKCGDERDNVSYLTFSSAYTKEN